MVSRDDDESVRIGDLEVDALLDRAVKLDGVVNKTLGVHVMGLLVDGGTFNHEDKTLNVVFEDLECLVRHLFQQRLVRECSDGSDGSTTTALSDFVE